MRALRVDKLTLAALQGTLDCYLFGDPLTEIPVLRMLTVTVGELAARGTKILSQLAARAAQSLHVNVVPSQTAIGGGSFPTASLESVAVALRGPSAGAVAAALRKYTVPIIGRIDAQRVLLDLRTVDPADDATIVAAIESLSP